MEKVQYPETALDVRALSSPLVFAPNTALVGSLERVAELADNQGKRIGILIVTYNAVTTLTKVLQRIPPQVWNNAEEVAIFDDASQDATFELAMGLKMLRSLPKLHVLRHPKNLGYGGNQKAAYRYFMERGFDVVILLHGDGQYAPEILAHLYHPIVAGEADAVFGTRMTNTYGGALKGGMPAYKYFGNRMLSAFENRALGMSLTEFHSGYRAYNLHALRKIDFTHMTDDFHFDTEIIIKLNHQKFRIREVPIPAYYGTELCYVKGLQYARNVVRAVYRYKQTRRSTSRHPEFQEYFVPYPLKESRHSSHSYALQMVGRDQDVLDLGCGAGYLAQELRQNGNRVTGVDTQVSPARSDVFVNYVCADLEQGIEPIIKQLCEKPFSRVLLLDVLEHLKYPEKILLGCHSLLRPEGELLVSVPNIANIATRVMLLFGKFEYRERGILDKTHLRFFTRKTARQLLEQCGFQIRQEKETVIPIEIVLDLPAHSLIARLLNGMLVILTKLFPGMFGYQIMFSAVRNAQ